MTRLRIDPEQVEQFVFYLTAYNRQLAERTEQVAAEFRLRRDSWSDAKYEEFAVQFERCAQMVRRFTETNATSTLPRMRMAVERARRYLR